MRKNFQIQNPPRQALIENITIVLPYLSNI